MKILALGDVTSPSAAEYLSNTLWDFRRKNKIDFVVVNGENASFITGASPDILKKLISAGADAVTGGNHTLANQASYKFLEESACCLRPVNYPADVPGKGYTILDAAGYRLMVINALGCVNMPAYPNNPFYSIERVLKREEGKYDFSILDFHAEATGEKLAMGYAFDGRINIIYGTHTHIPTADEQVLPKGSGYITDIGMCGESGGVLGMDSSVVVERMRLGIPKRFSAASGAVRAQGAVFTLDAGTGRVTEVHRVVF